MTEKVAAGDLRGNAKALKRLHILGEAGVAGTGEIEEGSIYSILKYGFRVNSLMVKTTEPMNRDSARGEGAGARSCGAGETSTLTFRARPAP